MRVGGGKNHIHRAKSSATYIFDHMLNGFFRQVLIVRHCTGAMKATSSESFKFSLSLHHGSPSSQEETFTREGTQES